MTLTIAGTGHRPAKLGGYSTAVFTRLVALARQELTHGFPSAPTLVISGGALGWDQALATAAHHLSIPYDLYLPFQGFEDNWPSESQDFLATLITHAHATRYISPPGFTPWKMQARNEAMVDACDHILALWDGTSGGTANCLAYANSRGVPIRNTWPTWVQSTDAAHMQDTRLDPD